MQAETSELADSKQSAGQAMMPTCFNLTEQFEHTCSAWEHYCTSCKLFQPENTPFSVLSLKNSTLHTVTANQFVASKKLKTHQKLVKRAVN